MARDDVERFAHNVVGALGHCVEEELDTIGPVLGALAFISVLWIVGVLSYEMIFDPYAAHVAARLDSLSIDPDKWMPRS